MSDRPTTGAHLRHGTAGAGPYALEITPESAGWGCSGLRVLELAPGGTHALSTGDDEVIVLPLSGGCTVAVDGETFVARGPRRRLRRRSRTSLYVPRDARVEVASDGGGRFALHLLPSRPPPGGALRARRPDRGRAARRRAGEPPGQQLLRAGGVRGRPPDRRRGAHARRGTGPRTRRTSTTRRCRASRRRSRRSTTSRSPAAASPTSASTAPARARDRRDRRGAQRRRDRHAARLPRPVDGGARATTSTTST